MTRLKLFDHIKNLTVHKRDFERKNDEHTKSYNKYMINRFISMVDVYVPFVNEINKYDVPKDVHHMFYKALLPRKQTFFKYIKSNKEISDIEKECLCEYYECTENELKHHLDILTKEQIKSIVDLYKRVKDI